MNLIIRYPKVGDLAELERCCLDDWALEYGFVHYLDSLLKRDCKELITFLPKMEKGIGIPQEHVPCTFMFVFDEENKIIGRTSIRHTLTEQLKRDGGHIGYAVMPDERKKGYATVILKKSLDYCKRELGLCEVLLTCDDDNIASIKTIEKYKGILIDRIPMQNTSVLKRRYKIIL